MHKFLDKKRSTDSSKDCSTSFMLSQLPVFPAPLLSPPPPPPPPPKFAPTNHNEGINHEEGSERSTDVGFDTSSQGSESDDQSVDESSRKAKSDFLRRIGFSALNALDSNGKSALHIAAKEGNAEVTRALLDDEDFQHVNAKDKSILKWTVLHEAAAAGNVKIVKILMQHTRFVKSDTRDRNGRTCLHLAAIHGSFGAVKAIVRDPLFASIGVKDHLGYTPQQRASDNGHEVIADYIGACVPSQKPPGLEICPRK
jgi:ankyrin repeat protein